MTIDFKVTFDGTLALTDVEIDAMQKMLHAHDRGSFYMPSLTRAILFSAE